MFVLEKPFAELCATKHWDEYCSKASRRGLLKLTTWPRPKYNSEAFSKTPSLPLCQIYYSCCHSYHTINYKKLKLLSVLGKMSRSGATGKCGLSLQDCTCHCNLRHFSVGKKVLHQPCFFPTGKSYNQHRIMLFVIWLLFCEVLPYQLARYWQSFLLQRWVVGLLSLGDPNDFQGNLGTYLTIEWCVNYFPRFALSSALLQRDS